MSSYVIVNTVISQYLLRHWLWYYTRNWEGLKAVGPGNVFSFQHRVDQLRMWQIANSKELPGSFNKFCRYAIYVQKSKMRETFIFRSDWNLNPLLWIPLESTASIAIRKRIRVDPSRVAISWEKDERAVSNPHLLSVLHETSKCDTK